MQDPLSAFIDAACVPLDAGHATGTLDRAQAILAEHPDVAAGNIHSAAILGDDARVREFIDSDRANATAKGGPREWDPLTHLCFSRYLRLDRSRSDSFVRAASALMDAGADPNTGWYEKDHEPAPEWESVIYGAAGIARHAALTQLLLDRGADPNDEETPYHAPETFDNAALEVLVKCGKLNDDSLGMILLRKTDWHDHDGIKWLLEQGADPNRMGRFGRTALHHAVIRDNSLKIIETLLDHGADPSVIGTLDHRSRGMSAIAIAARRGRGDLLELFERRGIEVELQGLEQLVARCAAGNWKEVRAIVERNPHLVSDIIAQGGKLICDFSGNGNSEGVRLLLDLGVDVRATYEEGDGYYGVARKSMALHVAAWRARHGTLKLLIDRGAPVNALDGEGLSPLALAVNACVSSYWTESRTPESVQALLEAGASVTSIRFPSGYAEVDELLRTHRARVQPPV